MRTECICSFTTPQAFWQSSAFGALLIGDEHFGDIICSLLANPSHTDESWEGRNTCLWIYILKKC